jgi:hypothetical protein
VRLLRRLVDSIRFHLFGNDQIALSGLEWDEWRQELRPTHRPSP